MKRGREVAAASYCSFWLHAAWCQPVRVRSQFNVADDFDAIISGVGGFEGSGDAENDEHEIAGQKI